MSRRFLDDIRNDLTGLLVTAGQTTAPELNALLIDMIDSTIQDEAAISSNTLSSGIATTTSFVSLTSDIYDSTIGEDAVFLKTSFTNGTITTTSTPGFTYEIAAKASIDGIDQNTSIEFTIMADGVAVGFVGATTGGHGSRPLSVDVTYIDVSVPADTVYTLGVRTADGAETINILSIVLGATIKPTNNP